MVPRLLAQENIMSNNVSSFASTCRVEIPGSDTATVVGYG